MKRLLVFTDGGARGNPGPSAIGVVIKSEGSEVLGELSQTIGIGTNNVAEYSAVVAALEWLKKNKTNVLDGCDEILFHLDSELVVHQLNGLYKIKHPVLTQLYFKVRELEQEVGTPIRYTAVRREQNKHADMLVNMALDGKPLP